MGKTCLCETVAVTLQMSLLETTLCRRCWWIPGVYVYSGESEVTGWGTVMINCILSCAVDHSLLRLCWDESGCCKHVESFSGSYLGIFFKNQPAVET